MKAAENIYYHFFKNILVFVIVCMVFQSCKVYQDPVSLDQAAASNHERYLKITLMNGDEYIYEGVEIIDGNYYGVQTKSGEKITTLLVKENVKEVQEHNKKSSVLFNILGITVGLASIYFGISML